MNLYLNNTNYGSTLRYYQSDKKSGWCFEMENGAYVFVPFDRIKLFTSSGTLEIVTKEASKREHVPGKY